MITYKDKFYANNIIETIRSEVDKQFKEHWSKDECQPEFLVSILFDKNIRNNKTEQYIILTCKHLSSVFSRVIFPDDESFYGYESILSVMESLYNQTM